MARALELYVLEGVSYECKALAIGCEFKRRKVRHVDLSFGIFVREGCFGDSEDQGTVPGNEFSDASSSAVGQELVKELTISLVGQSRQQRRGFPGLCAGPEV